MKPKINKIDCLFYFSIMVFVAATSLYVFNRKKIAKAVSIPGSYGSNNISAILKTLDPPTAGPCTGVPCTCSTTYTTTLVPSPGSAGALLCIPLVNTPNTGSAISASSVGWKILGYYTATEPTAASSNWGTALKSTP